MYKAASQAGSPNSSMKEQSKAKQSLPDGAQMAYLHSDAELAGVLSLKGDDAPVGGRIEADACKVDSLVPSSRPHLVAGIPWVGLEARIVDLQDWVQGPMHAAGHWIIHHHADHLHSDRILCHGLRRIDERACLGHLGTSRPEMQDLGLSDQPVKLQR